MSKSKIEWTDKTWNPVTGCTKVSPGCANCYAEAMSKRFAGKRGWGTKEDPFAVRLHPDRLGLPLKWKKPQKIFVCSMGDLFHEDVPFEFIDKVFAVMALSPQHTFQVLTKRPERMRDYLSKDALWRSARISATAQQMVDETFSEKNKEIAYEQHLWLSATIAGMIYPLPNVWHGVTAENQEQADKWIPILLQIPAAIRFVSIEPMLGAVDITKFWDGVGGMPRGRKVGETDTYVSSLDWVIVGGESGSGARPMHLDWVRKVRDDCKEAKVPFFFKQVGEWRTEEIEGNSFELKDLKDNQQIGMGMKPNTMTLYTRVGKAKAGSLLDGVSYKEFPGEALGDE